jgi:nicotinate-nucleotide pyrophosphorylase (carboxylating)
MDTRKTTPCMRELEKYAVRAGGGMNHRMGLFDQVLVKDNHIAYMEKKGETLDIGRVKQNLDPDIMIEVEAKDLQEVEDLLKGECPDIIMLDNMESSEMKKAVDLIKKQNSDIIVEGSGGVTLENVREIAETGIDRISVGELTHSVRSLDIGFYI